LLQRCRVRLMRFVCPIVGFLLVMDALSSRTYALPPPVPEIDPGSATSALTLLFGGLLLLAHRGRRK
jgi:hypothetical protein